MCVATATQIEAKILAFKISIRKFKFFLYSHLLFLVALKRGPEGKHNTQRYFSSESTADLKCLVQFVALAYK